MKKFLTLMLSFLGFQVWAAPDSTLRTEIPKEKSPYFQSFHLWTEVYPDTDRVKKGEEKDAGWTNWLRASVYKKDEIDLRLGASYVSGDLNQDEYLTFDQTRFEVHHNPKANFSQILTFYRTAKTDDQPKLEYLASTTLPIGRSDLSLMPILYYDPDNDLARGMYWEVTAHRQFSRWNHWGLHSAGFTEKEGYEFLLGPIHYQKWAPNINSDIFAGFDTAEDKDNFVFRMRLSADL